ncbi:MAG: PAS domain S-box protein [Anaerolineaceae bacterium]|nr:PAS domain S-box protein [Anaerolineaceae bacterium]
MSKKDNRGNKPRRNSDIKTSRYISLIDSVPIGIYTSHLDGRFLDVNQALVELFEFENPEHALKTGIEILYSDKSERLKILNQVMANESPQRFDVCFRRMNGEEFWAELYTKCIRDEDGSLLYFQGSISDITRRKEEESFLREQVLKNQLLIEQTNRNSFVLKALNEIYIILRTAKTKKEMVPILVHETAKITKAKSINLLLFEGGGLLFAGAHGRGESWIGAHYPIAISKNDQDPCWKAVHKKTMIVLETEPHFATCSKLFNQLVFWEKEFCIVTPLLTPDNEVIGIMIAVFSQDINRDEILPVIKAIAETSGNALFRAGVMDTLEERVNRQAQTLSVLYDLTLYTNQSSNLKEVVVNSLCEILKVVQGETAFIQLNDHDGKMREVFFYSTIPGFTPLKNLTDDQFSQLDIWVESNPVPIMVADLNYNPNLPKLLQFENHHLYFGTPIQAKNRKSGFLHLYRLNNKRFEIDEISILTTFAELFNIGIENIRFGEQAEEHAIIQERQRLARELHDSATQSLYSLMLFSQAGEDFLETDDQDGLLEIFTLIREITRQAMKEMRLLLYELGPSILEKEDLPSAINLRLDAVERRTGIQAVLNIEGDLRRLASNQGDIYWIIIEALNNALKHAAAKNVNVDITVIDNHAEIIVEDDGLGFQANSKRVGMGLQTMRERAAHINGWIEVKTKESGGTMVQLIISNLQQEPERNSYE